MKHAEEGSMKVHVDCKNVWELLTPDSLKSSQRAGCSVAIARKIIALEKSSKEEFECTQVRTKDDEEIAANDRDKLIAMLCDFKAKEERIKCAKCCKNENVKSKGNAGIKFGNTKHEKSISEVIRHVCSGKNSA